MYNQSHAIHLKVTMLKQMNKCSKDFICIFIVFLCLEKLLLKFNCTEVD